MTERRTVDADGVTASRSCKDEEDDDKRYEGLGARNKKRMVEMEMAVSDVAKPRRRKLRTNERAGGRTEKQGGCPVTR